MKHDEAPGSAPLPEPKQEVFAQLLATGVSCEEAHQKAGYTKNRGNAYRLSRRAEVEERVAYLQFRIETEVIAAEISARSTFSYAKSDALRELEEVRVKALEKGSYSAAVSAVMGKAKIAGLLVDKSFNVQKRIEDMTRDELIAFDPGLAEEFGAGDAGAGSLESARPAGRA
jgi:hypothetical protein